MALPRLPSSPSRTQALADFEPILLRAFNEATAEIDTEIRDIMHYTLFSVNDRFCVTSAWLLAPALGISLDRLALPACALETLRCSTVFKGHDVGLGGFGGGPVSESRERYVEPALSEAATYGLVPLAFQMLLMSSSPSITASERGEVASILAKRASPVRVLTALHREKAVASQLSSYTSYGHIPRFGGQPAMAEIVKVQQEKIAPVFEGAGFVLEKLAGARPSIKPGALAEWFKKLGLFAYWLANFTASGTAPLKRTTGIASVLSAPEALDAIMSLEAELLDRARELEIQRSAHELIDPLTAALKAQLQ